MGTLIYDDKATQRLLALYVTPDVVSQRRHFLRAFDLKLGERVLDVGAGPGFLASEISEIVGSSGSVCGVDISGPLIEVARARCGDKCGIEFRYGDATQLPYQDEEFDAVVSTQVLEYVPDVDAALSEIRRVLRPGGRVGLLDTDWDSIVWHSPDRERMNRILTAWEEHAADPFLPRTLGNRLSSAGFGVDVQEVMPICNPRFDESTYSNRVIDLIVPFVVGREGISKDESENWAQELRAYGEAGEYFFSLNRYFFLATKL